MCLTPSDYYRFLLAVSPELTSYRRLLAERFLKRFEKSRPWASDGPYNSHTLLTTNRRLSQRIELRINSHSATTYSSPHLTERIGGILVPCAGGFKWGRMPTMCQTGMGRF